jgi:hypothetical protein
MPRRRNPAMSKLSAFALLAAAIATSAQAQQRMRIVAGPVQERGDCISGTFRVEPARARGIVSDGTGGACLVADLDPRACRSDADCADAATPYGPDSAAYCLRPKHGVMKNGHCWVRPGPGQDYCRKSPQVPLPLRTTMATPDVCPPSLPGERPVRWRVHACLNGHDQASDRGTFACGDPADDRKMIDNGPMRRVP